MTLSLSNGQSILLRIGRLNNQPTFLVLPPRKFRLTNSHKICIFRSGIHRVVVQIFLRFQGKKAWDQKETFVKYRQSQG